MSARKGKWTAVEDSQLKHAVQPHGDKDWVVLSALVPGPTKKQCWNRWDWITHMEPNRSAVPEKDSVLSIRRLLWGGILTPVEVRRIHGLE